MCMSKLPLRGFTLVELIIFIVVVSVGLAGILAVMSTTVRSSADPLVRKQVMTLADSTLEEILQKEYSDPDGVQGGESTRASMDDVDDFHSKSQTLFNSTSGAGGWPASLDSYQLQITVAPDTSQVGTVARPAKQITVVVSKGTESITITGFRAKY
jgi:MSHA pilin protein MshD